MTHTSLEILSNPDLFRVNKISYNEMLVNLCTLLAGKDATSAYVSLPTNKDVEKLLGTSSGEGSSSTDEDDEIAVGMYYVTLITEGKNDTWYIASCLEKHDNDRYKMEYLHRVQDKSNLKWKNGNEEPDILKAESIVICDIDGEWDVSKERNMTFTLRNHEYIDQLVKSLVV